MRTYSLSHLGDGELLRALAALVARERATTAELLAHIAEVDARRLYLPAAHPSMFSYCVHELRLSEDAAYKRIQAARAARQFPALFEALAAGRLHLSAVCLLAPYLTIANADDLLEAAAHRTKAEVETLVAARFPRSEALGLVEILPISPASVGQAPDSGTLCDELAPGQVVPDETRRIAVLAGQLAPGQVVSAPERTKLAPLARERFVLQLTIGQGTHDKLRYVQELLGHQVPTGDLAQVLDHALDALINQLERRKFAATSRPRRTQRPTTSPRHIPAEVRRRVRKRDGGRCTFENETGHRCPARTRLEFDHVQEVARGGRATVDGIRLRCRAHNQYEAERTFGIEFMRGKREQARQRTGEARRIAETRQAAEAQAHVEAGRAAADEARCRAAHARVAAEEVIPALRALGFRAAESRQAATFCEAIPNATLEDRVKTALSYLCPRPRPHGAASSLAAVP